MTPNGPKPSFRGDTLEEFLAAVAARRPAPSGGAVAAVTVAAAAGLVAMSARFSNSLADATGLADAADQIREQATGLADADARAYGEVLAALRTPRDDPARPPRLRSALRRAAEVPLSIAEAGAQVARLGAAVAAAVNPHLTGDVHAAVILAEAAARAAASLVRINVDHGALDPALTAAADNAAAEATRLCRAATRGPERPDHTGSQEDPA